MKNKNILLKTANNEGSTALKECISKIELLHIELIREAKELKRISNLANNILLRDIFTVENNIILNVHNRYAGNDISLIRVNKMFVLMISFNIEIYHSIGGAAQGLADAYTV